LTKKAKEQGQQKQVQFEHTQKEFRNALAYKKQLLVDEGNGYSKFVTYMKVSFVVLV
jgi:hypothetical protein